MKILEVKGYQKNDLIKYFFEDKSTDEILNSMDKESTNYRILIQLDAWYDGIIEDIDVFSTKVLALPNNDVPANRTQDIILVAASKVVEGIRDYWQNDKGMQIGCLYDIHYPKWIMKDGKIIFGKKEGKPTIGQKYFRIAPEKIVKIFWGEIKKYMEDK